MGINTVFKIPRYKKIGSDSLRYSRGSARHLKTENWLKIENGYHPRRNSSNNWTLSKAFQNCPKARLFATSSGELSIKVQRKRHMIAKVVEI